MGTNGPPDPGSGVTGAEQLIVRRRRNVGRWVASFIVLLILATLIRSVVTNPRFEWNVVGQYLFDPAILKGFGITVFLTVICMAIGLALGVVLAVMRLASNPLVKGLSILYITWFRGTPVLVQLIFWFNLAALYPVIHLGVPFGPNLFELNATTVITPLLAAVLGLGLNEGAYMAEIVRGGLMSVPKGQTEAAHALGMSSFHTLRRIILPQAMRFMVPPTGNETINMTKNTAIVSVIAVSDLLYSAQTIYTRTFQVIPLLIVASLWYLVLIAVMSLIQEGIERHYARGVA